MSYVLPVTCSCGCGETVYIDGLGSAKYESLEGVKHFLASEVCRIRWKKALHPSFERTFRKSFEELFPQAGS